MDKIEYETRAFHTYNCKILCWKMTNYIVYNCACHWRSTKNVNEWISLQSNSFAKFVSLYLKWNECMDMRVWKIQTHVYFHFKYESICNFIHPIWTVAPVGIFLFLLSLLFVLLLLLLFASVLIFVSSCPFRFFLREVSKCLHT